VLHERLLSCVGDEAATDMSAVRRSPKWIFYSQPPALDSFRWVGVAGVGALDRGKPLVDNGDHGV
jgi:hypothetical protein